MEKNFKPLIAHLNIPTAVIEGHIIKVDDDVQRPIASLWKGGGTHGRESQKDYANLLSAAPDMYKALLQARKYLADKNNSALVIGILKDIDTAFDKVNGKNSIQY